ncbi:MAG TPA: Bcr/CflA family efflux MFS transporter [Burkholderiaceae bacterium]|nr:Bcr/CflA family efflux MFS transporter [Burkholderiaceae bacterium]
MTQGIVVVTLTLLLGIQPVTTDLYLPAMPLLAVALDAPAASAQLTLSSLIIAFGVSQLFWGPLSDRFGRRPMLLAGLALYSAAALAAALAPAMDWLIAARTLQGIGMGAAVACGRSVIRDLYEPREGARVMSQALAGLGLFAMFGPLVGAVVAKYTDWRYALGVVTLFGVLSLAFVALRFVETVPRKNPQATRIGEIARNWWLIGRHPTFVAWTAITCASWCGLFAFLSTSSFVFIDVLGVGQVAYGAILMSSSFFYTAGTFLCRFLLRHMNAARAVAIGGAFSLAGGVSIIAVALAGVHSVAAFLPPIWLFTIGHGIHQPCGQAGVTSPFPDKAGTAASLSGFAMMASAFAAGIVLGRGMNGTVYPLAFGVGSFGVLTAIVAWTLVRAHGDRQVHAPATAQA